MAKVVITIEDLPTGGVKLVSKPSFDVIVKMMVSGNELSSAEGYALFALNQIRSKSMDNKKLNLLIPKIGR